MFKPFCIIALGALLGGCVAAAPYGYENGPYYYGTAPAYGYYAQPSIGIGIGVGGGGWDHGRSGRGGHDGWGGRGGGGGGHGR
jgi:hypothetical protein